MLNNPFRRRFFPPHRELARLEVRPDDVVADLGAGAGFFDPELRREVGTAGHLIVVEPDANHLARIREYFGADPQVRYLNTSAADLREIESGTIDRALLSLVICCLVDKEGALDEVWRILRPGGRALISYPRRRGLRLSGGPALRVTPSRWAALVGRRPWTVLPCHSSWVVARHLLQKPLESEGPPAPPSSPRPRSDGRTGGPV